MLKIIERNFSNTVTLNRVTGMQKGQQADGNEGAGNSASRGGHIRIFKDGAVYTEGAVYMNLPNVLLWANTGI